MAPHSSTLAWKIPWTEEPGWLQSMGSRRVGHDGATSLSLFTFMHWRRKWQPTLVFLPGESQGRGSLVGCRLRGRTESDTTEVTQHSIAWSAYCAQGIAPLLGYGCGLDRRGPWLSWSLVPVEEANEITFRQWQGLRRRLTQVMRQLLAGPGSLSWGSRGGSVWKESMRARSWPHGSQGRSLAGSVQEDKPVWRPPREQEKKMTFEGQAEAGWPWPWRPC